MKKKSTTNAPCYHSNIFCSDFLLEKAANDKQKITFLEF